MRPFSLYSIGTPVKEQTFSGLSENHDADDDDDDDDDNDDYKDINDETDDVAGSTIYNNKSNVILKGNIRNYVSFAKCEIITIKK